VSTVSQRLHAHLARFADARVLVLGDLMMDHYVWGRVQRISPEAPVPVVDVTSESVMLGGAGNVFLNLASLGAACICGVVGQDAAGARCSTCSGGAAYPATDRRRGGASDHAGARVIAHQQQVVRFDRGTGARSRRRLAALAGTSTATFGMRTRWCRTTPRA
jgi:D-beta-D-heptose 7-phosphate kinase/D-beta-D-heptose 1-phosphate adenosyltransferase